MSTPKRRPLGSAGAAAIERQVRGNVLARSFGAATVAQLNLPEHFLRRCADRAIISSFNERHRLVVGDAAARPIPQPLGADGASPVDSVQLIDGASIREPRWASLPDETPAVGRGFKFPPSGAAAAADLGLPGEGSPYEVRRAATIVARTLARDGLGPVAIEAAIVLRPLQVVADPARLESLLAAAGIPVDLLAMLELSGPGGFARAGCVAWLASQTHVKGGENLAASRASIRRAQLAFEPSLPGFRATDDAGAAAAHAPLLARLQLTRGDDWFGIGDGGAVDIARQVAASLPGVPLLISARQDHAPVIAQLARGWSSERGDGENASITIMSEAVTVSQWAQDNARAGSLLADGHAASAALLPRYSSRGSELSAFVPGDSAIGDSLEIAGIRTARSPLHFQGGNTILVHDAVAARRVLLVGEAEVYRNVALGLSSAQSLDCLRIELGADQAVMLPSPSYHIDYEVLCLSAPGSGRITVFVADQEAGERCIVAAGLAALQRANVFDSVTANRLHEGLHAGTPEAVNQLRVLLRLQDGAANGFPFMLASHFSTGSPGESAIGNFLTFLDALDSLSARVSIDQDLEGSAHEVAMHAARCRLNSDRAAMATELAELGWGVVQIPCYNAAARSVCPLNAVRVGNTLLLPQVRGLFSELDARANAVIWTSVPGLIVEGMTTAESQRRNGSLRCALSIFS